MPKRFIEWRYTFLKLEKIVKCPFFGHFLHSWSTKAQYCYKSKILEKNEPDIKGADKLSMHTYFHNRMRYWASFLQDTLNWPFIFNFHAQNVIWDTIWSQKEQNAKKLVGILSTPLSLTYVPFFSKFWFLWRWRAIFMSAGCGRPQTYARQVGRGSPPINFFPDFFSR